MRVLFLLFASVFISMPALCADDMEIWNPYLEKIEKDVKASWYDITANQRHERACRTTLFFTVKNSGALGTIAILFSDCNKQMQDNALLAVKKVSPFAPFPKKFSNVDEININYNLDYRLLPENQSAKIPQNTVKPVVSDSLEKVLPQNSAVQSSQLPAINKKVVLIKFFKVFVPIFLALDALAFVLLVLLSKKPKILELKGLSFRRDIILFLICSAVIFVLFCVVIFFCIGEYGYLHKMTKWL